MRRSVSLALLCLISACSVADPGDLALCSLDEQCPEGMVCDGQACREPCLTTGDCPAGYMCVAGVCLLPCESDSDCPSGEICFNGLCRPETKPDGGTVDGGGQTDGGVQQCTPGEVICRDSDTLATCNMTGSGWENYRDCPDGKYCLLAECQDMLCLPGTLRCVDLSSYERCNGQGSAWEPAGSCDPGWECRDGTCMMCTPGEGECVDSGTINICNADGSGWVPEACQAGTVCVNHECVAQICIPGNTACSGVASIMVCNLDGTGYDMGPDCAANQECQNGQCLSACEVADMNRSSIGCVYYAVDTNWLHSPSSSPYVPGTFAVAISNTDPGTAANVVIEVVNAGVWTPVAGGTFTVEPLALVSKVLDHRLINGSAIFRGGAYRITSDLPMIAYQFNPLDGSQSFLSDASLLLPKSALDTYHFVSAWPQGPADDNKPQGFPARIQIVASASTEVRVTSPVPTIAGSGVSALVPGVTAAFQLDEGDFLQLTIQNHMDSFTGTFIESDQPVGVFAANDCANVPASLSYCCCEHLEEQLFGLQTWGKVYAASRGPQRGSEPAIWHILAYEDDTTVTFDANPAVTGLPGSLSLDRGEWEEIQVGGSGAHPGDFLVIGDKPILVVQYMVGAWMVQTMSTLGDPAMVQAVPVEQYLTRYVVLVPTTWQNDYFILTRKIGSTITIGGVEASASWSQIGSSEYEVARVSIPDGVHLLEGSLPFGVIVMGYDQYDSYAYPGGLNLQQINPF